MPPQSAYPSAASHSAGPRVSEVRGEEERRWKIIKKEKTNRVGVNGKGKERGEDECAIACSDPKKK